jgi:phosphatidylinositol alpha-mannosyltransferase
MVHASTHLERIMNIGIVSPYSFSIPGGVNQQVLTHAKALSQKGHQVFVMGPGQLSNPQGFIFYSIGETVAFPFANGSTANICLKLEDPKALLKFISDQEIQVLHMHEPLMPYGNWFLLNQVTIPVLGTFHAFAQKNIPYQLMGWYLKKYFRKLSAVTAVSGPAHSMVSKFFNGDAQTKITVIPNCVALSAPQSSVTNQFDWLRDGKKNILFLGRFEKRKGLDVLVDAVSGGVFHEKNLRLVVVGSGKTTDETGSVIANATQKLGDRVAFLGKLSDGDLSKVFEMSHVFVAPSLGGESFGVILLEAIRAKIPVIASDIDGYRWVLDGEKYGLLSAPGDSKMLAQTIDKLLKNEVLRNTLINESQKRLKMFDADFVVEKYVNQYESLVNDNLSVDKPSKK